VRWLSEERREAPPDPLPVERLTADLRRLRAKLEDTETRADLIAKHHRVVALRGAYLETLSATCQRLGISPPAPGACLAEIYRVEAALRERGIEVRETVDRLPRPGELRRTARWAGGATTTCCTIVTPCSYHVKS
jgi:hypothetical protein